MAKKLFQRFMPDPKKIKHNRYLKIFGNVLHNPNLWHLNRHSVARAVSIGLFIAYMPLPGHMVLAAFFAILFRANLPMAASLVWIANPLTYIPMFTFAYKIGAHILGTSVEHWDLRALFAFQGVWEPIFLGSFICGIVLAVLGNISVRLLWRYTVVKQWQSRQLRRRHLQALSQNAPL